MPSPHPQPVLFTDLDGTLLDSATYSWEAATPAMKRLEERAIPWILCTSKTRAELLPLRRDLGHRHPFIVENGGAILIPEDYFRVPYSADPPAEGFRRIRIGVPYPLLRAALKQIAEETGIALPGFGDMDANEIARRTGLTPAEAGLAKTREYDEPFLLQGNPRQQQAVLDRIASGGLQWTLGGRFYHLTGNNDKGRAVTLLSEIYRRQCGRIVTVGLGDSQNDLPMLAAVDRPILVQKPDGGYEDAIALSGLERAEGIGPVGWNRAVLGLLKEFPISP